MEAEYGVRYRGIHTDFINDVWRVDLLLKNYEGPIEQVVPSGVPVVITTFGEGDQLGGLKAKEWIIEFLNITNFQFLDIFTGTGRRYMMKLYKNDIFHAAGFCDPDNYSEEFVSDAYPSRIHVHDGLGELKNVYFSMPDNPEGTFYRSVLSYIAKALSMTGLNLPINIASDFIFKKKDGTEVTQNIFEELTIDWRVFRLGEDSWWDYNDILTYIIASFDGMRLFQESGAWWIDRASPMKAGNYTVDKYSAGEDAEYIGSFSKDPVQALTSNTIESDKVCRFGSSCELSMEKPWKRFSIAQQYELKKTILNCKNLEGILYEDDWRSNSDLWYWSRSNVIIEKLEDSSIFFRGFTYHPDLYPPYSNFLQSDSIYLNYREDILKLRESWGDTPWWKTKDFSIGMKLSVEYLFKEKDWNPEAIPHKVRFYLRVSLQDAVGQVFNTTNYLIDPLTGEHLQDQYVANFSPHGDDNSSIIEVVPVVNEWSVAEFVIPNIALRLEEDGLDQWSFRLKIYPPQSDLNSGSVEWEDGLIIKSIKLGFYDKNDQLGKRVITEEVDTENRQVPSAIDLKFGDTPGHWGEEPPYCGQQFMDRYIYTDSEGSPVTIFGTQSSGLGTGGLLQGIMTSNLLLQHKLPLFKLRGSVRDNPDNIDFCSSLQDYDGRIYVPTGMERDVGMAEVQAEWMQVRMPEQEEGGEFNWDFSDDFNIGTVE